ncbi:MAG: hypothetical protein LUF27_05145 [Lachnospiraceae bacterium]|nr:hypothetical protein [Lachnospiraceae bacterium]
MELRSRSKKNCLFAAFFMISGAQLELSVFSSGIIVLIGLVYILTRSAGKYIGAFLSAKATHCSDSICKLKQP